MRRHALQQYHGMLGAQNECALLQPHRTNRLQNKSGESIGAVYGADGCRSSLQSSAAKLAKHLALVVECCLPLQTCGSKRALQQRCCPPSTWRLHLTWSDSFEFVACPSSASRAHLDCSYSIPLTNQQEFVCLARPGVVRLDKPNSRRESIGRLLPAEPC